MTGPAPPGGLRQSRMEHRDAGLPHARAACFSTCGADTPMRFDSESVGRGLVDL